TNLAVTNANSVRLSLDNDTKSTTLTARSPRHGNSPGNYNEFRTSGQIIRLPRRRALVAQAACREGFARRNVMEYRDVVRLDWFDAGKPNDLRPLLDVIGDEPAELGRRDRMDG